MNDGDRHVLDVRVRYNECDPMGVAHRLESAKMISNFACRQSVEAWLERHPHVVPAGWDGREAPRRWSQRELDDLAASIEAAAASASRLETWARLVRALT